MNFLLQNKNIKDKLSSIKRQFIKRKGYLKTKWNTKHIYGYKRIEREQLDCIVICIVKDAEKYIDRFIQHYLEADFKHIIFMDNGSTDRTIEIASQYDRVTILRCLLPFRKNKYNMLQYLIHKYSFNCWCLIADCDEFFDYPYSDRISLKDFVKYLENNQYTAVLNQMLDMYPEHPISSDMEENQYIKSHYWFDIDTIEKRDIPPGLENEIDFNSVKLHYGGVRKRIFDVLPLISKFSLIKPNPKLYMVRLHFVSWAKVADFNCVLYHYKFIGNFYQKVKQAVASGQYYNNSAEYKSYKNTLQKNPSLNLYCEGHSIKLQGTEQLVNLGFLQVSDRYKQYVFENQKT
ncbi:glycosyltransferase family 2 protein [Geitlerinema sp. PCC 9228]|uniref:glycosyltransferase family 2 protein n=1 Tax=Geitlerinema sp. PCC 9228 TaxID=111611 RepID=UPI0008F9CE95|nr:glycosyltransferase family 2 protein [Geitlerinema sp. PCC 9228]